MISKYDSNPQCCICGLYDSDLQFSHQKKGWTYQWIKIASTINTGYKRWTCGPCLWLLLSGYKVKGIERIDKK